MAKQIDESLEYWTEVAILDFTEELARVMKRDGVSQASLARRIGNSQAHVSQVLNGHANFTIATMTKWERALDKVLHLHLSEEGVIVRWQDKSVMDSDPTVTMFRGAPRTEITTEENQLEAIYG